MLAATATPKHHHITEDDEEMTNGDHSGDVSRDLDIDENIKDPVEDRRTLAERSERLNDQLRVSNFECIPFGQNKALCLSSFYCLIIAGT